MQGVHTGRVGAIPHSPVSLPSCPPRLWFAGFSRYNRGPDSLPGAALHMPRVLFLFFLALALQPEAVRAAGDPEAGRVKGFTCTGCHGIPGYKNTYPTYHVPKLGGQNEAYLVAALTAYKTGQRRHATMNLQAESLSGQDIEDIAAWLASVGAGAGE